MVGGRRRGRLVDAEEESTEDKPDKKKQQQKVTAALKPSNSGEAGLGVIDPGPGDALVSLTASSDRRPPNRINKQALASRSHFFKTALQPHFNPRKDSTEVHLKVSSDLVTEEAWKALLPHLSTGAAPILNLENVFDVLRAANYLQMDEAQTYITDYVKAHISKADFLDAYNFARQTKIDCLTGTIETTIVRPEESMRRRMYGAFDSTLQLGCLSYRCHRAVLGPAIVRVGEHLREDGDVLDVKVIGVTEGHLQHLYTLLEAVYLGTFSSLLGSSLEDILSYYSLNVRLKFTSPELETMIMQELSKLISMFNLASVSANSLINGHHAIRNLYLVFLIGHPAVLEKEVMHLTRREVEAVLSSDWLELEGGEVGVAELALAWLKNGRQGEDGLLAKCVRWSLLRPGEVEGMMAKLSPRWVDEVQKECSNGRVGKAREWPRLLVLVETPQVSPVPNYQHKVHAYNFESKSWEVVTKVPRSDRGGWQLGYAVSVLSDSLVISSSNSNQPFLPVACQTYCISSDKWSEVPSLANTREDWFNEEEHMTAVLGSQVYTVLTRREKLEGEVLALQYGTPEGAWTITPCAQRVPARLPAAVLAVGGSIAVVLPSNVDGKTSVDLVRFNPVLQEQPQAGGRPLQSKELKHHCNDVTWATHNGKIICVGGGHGREVITWGLEGGEGRLLGKLQYRRRSPGVGCCRGKLWVAGGRRHCSVDDNIDIERTVESYDDVVDSWVCLANSPQLGSAKVVVVEVRKPLRMMDTNILSNDSGAEEAAL